MRNVDVDECLGVDCGAGQYIDAFGYISVGISAEIDDRVCFGKLLLWKFIETIHF